MLKNPLVEKAYDFAVLSLAGKKRYSGEFVTDHCIRVVEILERYEITDPVTLSVAMLHHSIENGAAKPSDIEKEFGKEIADMLVTLDTLKVIKINEDSVEHFIENLRKMFMSMANDLRIVLIKLADIYDNLTTLQYIPREKQIEVARETIEIFAPLAERLGMGEMKGAMQDIAFPYLYPEDYEETKKILKTNVEELEKKLLRIKSELNQELTNKNISFRIESRAKHLYSLYAKLKRPEINFDISKVYDLIAFRVIVKTKEECYQTLDAVHKLWRPMQNYVRDYIDKPKQNGYQSIHTTVFGSDNEPFEIQIRTEEMHEDAEFGVAAHWQYSASKEKKGATDENVSKGFIATRLDWVKSLSKWQEEVVDNEEFLKTVKTDFFNRRIFVFTPKGEVKDLPADATPVDFAYKVHTDLGDRAMGAKVNGKIAPLDSYLKNGDVVEVIVSKEKKKPSRDWLNFVVTSQARREIKKAFK